MRNKSLRHPQSQAQRKPTQLATVRNHDVAGVHNDYDFNMQITIGVGAIGRTVDKMLD
ncbi:MAG: hypothetical protein ABSG91_24360 [Syntrophobacteraceae bacterium]